MMAKDTQQTVPLGQDWREHWAFFFPDDGDWKSTLKRMILSRVALLEFNAPALGNMNPQRDLPNWAHSLRITLNDQMISMNIIDRKPLIKNALG